MPSHPFWISCSKSCLGAGGASKAESKLASRSTSFAGEGGSEAITTTGGIYERDALCAGHVVSGPAIILEMDSTTLVLPDHHATVDKFGNLDRH